MTNEKLIRDRIEELLQKIDSGQGDLKELLKYISEVGELERTLIDAKTRFCKRVLELVPIGNIKGVYRITHTLPLQYEEEYIETLSDGLSFDSDFKYKSLNRGLFITRMFQIYRYICNPNI